MGLDITAYGKVTLVEKISDEDTCVWERLEELQDEYSCLTTFYVNPNFPLQGEGIVRGVYSYYDTDDVDFRVSYSGWSNLRDSLAYSCGYTKATVSDVSFKYPDVLDSDNFMWRQSIESRPYQQSAFMGTSLDRLHYLLNFSDCEGVINTECCKTIYQDLLWLKEKDKENPCIEEHVINSFYKLLKLFKFAADNDGVVKFH